MYETWHVKTKHNLPFDNSRQANQWIAQAVKVGVFMIIFGDFWQSGLDSTAVYRCVFKQTELS